MIFKRKEGFRFAFGEPIEAGFIVLLDGKPVGVGDSRMACKVLDVSPHGIKMMTDVNLNDFINKTLQLEIFFTLDHVEIRGIGEVVWSKKFGSGYHYGIVFYDQPGVESLIISELKARRRKETLVPKNKG